MNLFPDPESEANKAVYALVRAYSDITYSTLIHRHYGKGNLALQLLQQHSAQFTPTDMNFFNQELHSMSILPNETASSFICRFNFARSDAETVGNTYEDGQLVDLFLSGMRHTKQLQYLSDLASFRTQRDNNPSQTNMATIESRFSAIDEDISRGAAQSHHVNLISANRNMFTRDKSKKRSFTSGNAKSANNRPKPPSRPSNPNATSRSSLRNATTPTRQTSNIRCHRCGQRGHIMRNCTNRPSLSSSTSLQNPSRS